MMKTALFLAFLAGSLLSTSGESSLGATQAKLRALREQVSLLGEILDRSERVADMVARQEGGGGGGGEDTGSSGESPAVIFEKFFYGLMSLMGKLIKGEDYTPKLLSLSQMLEGLPKNYSKVTHNTEQKGNTTINTTTTIEKSQKGGNSYSFGNVQTSAIGPNQKSFSSVIQKVFQSSSSSSSGDKTANDNTAGNNPPTGNNPPADNNPPAENNPPAATAGNNPPAATPTPKAADQGSQSARRLRLLDLLEQLRLSQR
ncbi:uncharacterized protein LOC144873550 [Branchiostoma floridae x Branchiostoma japonicum]